MEQVEMTNMCMIEDKKGNVLVQQRKKNWPGIAFPGGHMEAGESIYDSVLREVLEETGLTLRGVTLCGVKSWYDEKRNYRYLVFLFKAGAYEGALSDGCDEGEVFWVPKKKLFTLGLAEGFEHMVCVMEDPSLCEDYITFKEDQYLHLLK